MAWSTPRTWIAGELVTDVLGNQQWRDNFNIVKTCIDDSGDLAPPASTELTLASDAITPTQNVHTVDTQSDAASDDLTNIVTTNTRAGHLLILRPENAARVVTVKHNTGGGNIRLRNGNYAMANAYDAIAMQLVGTEWRELFRAIGGGGGKPCLVFTAQSNQPPASAFATPDTRNAHAVLDFDAATDESAIFSGVLPSSYAGGSIQVTLFWMATSATSGNVVWQAAWEALAATDLDADSFASAQTVTTACNGTSGILSTSAITFTSAQIDGLVAGGAFRLKVTRDADNGSDTMTGDAELLRVLVEEL